MRAEHGHGAGASLFPHVLSATEGASESDVSLHTEGFGGAWAQHSSTASRRGRARCGACVHTIDNLRRCGRQSNMRSAAAQDERAAGGGQPALVCVGIRCRGVTAAAAQRRSERHYRDKPHAVPCIGDATSKSHRGGFVVWGLFCEEWGVTPCCVTPSLPAHSAHRTDHSPLHATVHSSGDGARRPDSKNPHLVLNLYTLCC